MFSHNEVLRWVFAFASKWMYGDELYDHDDINLLYIEKKVEVMSNSETGTDIISLSLSLSLCQFLSILVD